MVKKFKLIFFMSLILILILGTTSQAVVSEDYMNYIWYNLENNSDFNIGGSYNTNFKSYLQQLIPEQKNSVKIKINQYLNTNNLNYEDMNLNVFLSQDAERTFNIYFVFSNNTAPNNNDLGYLEIKKDADGYTRLYVKNNNSFIKYLKVQVAYYKNSLHFTVDDFKDLLPLYGLRIDLGKTAYSENTEIFYSSNISCYKLTQVAYIGYPISSSSEKTRFLRNYSAYLNKDEGAYIPQEPVIPDKPSGDSGTGGTTGTITNPSGDTTGKVDLSGIEQGIGNINQNIDKTNEKLDGISGEINEVNNSINNINNFLSGDITKDSDDIKGSLTIDTSEIDDPSEDFFTWVFNQIQNVFTSTEDQSFSFKLFTENEYTISSSQIYVPESVIKTLIGLAGTFGIYYWIIKDVRKTINKIKEGNIQNLGNEDITANLL